MSHASLEPIDDRLGKILLIHARAAITEALTGGTRLLPEDPRLDAVGATFVTLTQAGQLRGCIGTVRAYRPLREDVRANAIAAALHDPRFPPLQPEELPLTRIEVSLLSPLEWLHFADEAELLAQLRPGVDGLMIFSGGHSATFLPQVWEHFSYPADFLAALKAKAGWDPWRPVPALQAARYTVHAWHEPESESSAFPVASSSRR